VIRKEGFLSLREVTGEFKENQHRMCATDVRLRVGPKRLSCWCEVLILSHFHGGFGDEIKRFLKPHRQI
jgi:hypothetical protein